MEKLSPVKIPLLNPNEPEVLLVSIEIEQGSFVEKGDVIAIVETTKSTGEILADRSGYLVGLRFKPGVSLQAGDALAYIGETADAKNYNLPPWVEEDEVKSKADEEISDIRITEPARALAESHGIDLKSLPHDRLITQEVIENLVGTSTPVDASKIPEGEKRILVYGAGGHGRSLAALLRIVDAYEIVGFLDDGYERGEIVYGLPLLGGAGQLSELASDGIRMAVNGVGGIGDLEVRLRVFDHLNRAGFYCPRVIHPKAFLEETAELAGGVQVFPFAYVGTEVRVGFGSIINTGAIVSHNCELGQYVNLSPGATLAGGVIVDEGALIGMRATINLYVHIGRRARIGNGATVKADVPDGGVVPAGTIWPPRK